MSNPAQLSLFLSITLTFSTSLMSAYGDDYGCENSTILGTSYYTSWTPTSITTAEGSCSSEDVDVDLAGIVAGTLLLMGAIWFIAPDASADEESKILKLYKSESRFGIAFQALPEKYYLRAVINNPLQNDHLLLKDKDQIFESNLERMNAGARLEFGINF
jgi:hypothetical protein